MKISPVLVGSLLLTGIFAAAGYKYLIEPNQIDMTAKAPALGKVQVTATTSPAKEVVAETPVDVSAPPTQSLSYDKTKDKEGSVEAKVDSNTLTLDKTYTASDKIQKKYISNDPNAVILSISKSTNPIQDLAAKYKANVEKGPISNQNGWPHIVIDTEGNAFSIVSIYKTVQNTLDKSSALFTTKGKQFKKSVDQNSIQIELGKVSDPELQALGKLLKELNADGTMPPNRVFARWAVTPSTSTQDNAIINPSGKITPELTKLVEYAGYPAGSETVILKSNIQNAILRLRSKGVKQTPNDFQLSYLIKAYNSLK